MPEPRAGEEHNAYISRAMADPEMVRKFPDTAQRYKVADSLWDDRKHQAYPGGGNVFVPGLVSVRRKRKPARFAKAGGGQWITIGAREGADGKRHGGSPVYVEGGRIVKGHPGLTGKHISSLDKSNPDKPPDEAPTHRQAQHREKEYQRAVWGKKARKQGVDPKHLHQLAGEMLAHDKAFAEGRKQMLRDARKKLTSLGYDPRALATNIGSGRIDDAEAVPYLDDVAQSMEESYPEHFHGHGDATERLFELLGGGNPEAMSEHEAYDKALEVLLAEPPGEAEEPLDQDKPLWEGEEEAPF